MADAKITRIASPRRELPGEDPAVARLSAMVVALLAELTIVRERLDTMERVAERAGAFTRAAIEGFEPDAEADGERNAIRSRQIAKVMRPFLLQAVESPCASLSTAADEILVREMQR